MWSELCGAWERLSECWQKPRFMLKLRTSAITFTSFPFACFCRHACVAPSIRSFSQNSFFFAKDLPCKTLHSSSAMYFTFLFYFQLSGFPFLMTAQKPDSAVSSMQLKFLTLLKKVYKSKSTQTKFQWGQHQAGEEFVLLCIGSYITFHKSWLPSTRGWKRVS